MAKDEEFVPQEIAYRRPGAFMRTSTSDAGWRRKTVRTQRAMDRLLAKLEEQGVTEIRTRNAEGF